LVAARVGAVLVAALTLGGCAKGDSPTGPGGGKTPHFGHVFVVTEENTDYVDAIGSVDAVPERPGDRSTAPDMSEFFTS